MIQDKKRKEVSLDEETIALLEIQAKQDGRKLKNFMEQILIEKANDFDLSDEYKVMMDRMLKKHEEGNLDYTIWEEVKKELFRK